MSRYSGIWHCAVWRLGTDFQEQSATSIFKLPWSRKQRPPKKRWYLSTMPDGVTFKKTVFLIQPREFHILQKNMLRHLQYTHYSLATERNRQRIRNSTSTCSAKILHDDCRVQFKTNLHSGPAVHKNGQGSNVWSSNWKNVKIFVLVY
jgi:hypothetical protein